MSGSVIHGAAGDGGGDDDSQAPPASSLDGKRQGPGAVGELLARVAVVMEFVHEEVRAGGGRAVVARRWGAGRTNGCSMIWDCFFAGGTQSGTIGGRRRV